MKAMSAKAAKNGFGLLLDAARAEPVTIEKHGRPVVVVLAVEEYERLKGGTRNVTGAFNATRGIAVREHQTDKPEKFNGADDTQQKGNQGA